MTDRLLAMKVVVEKFLIYLRNENEIPLVNEFPFLQPTSRSQSVYPE